MAQPKHTPGPWAVGKYTPTENFKAITNHACVCDSKTMALIATTGPADDRQSQIDADLMSAAPDLLDALEQMLKAYGEQSAVCDLARSAIAKAKGESA